MRACLTILIVGFVALIDGGVSRAEEGRRLLIAAPDDLVDTGFLQHLLPRFALKHGVPVSVAAAGQAADAEIVSEPTDGARAVFSGGGVAYFVSVPAEAKKTPDMEKLLAWLGSDVGRNTIAAFKGQPAFTATSVAAVEKVDADLPGDVARGLGLSREHCGRCHVVDQENPFGGLGSTPSFAVLRTFPDWLDRFSAFHVLKPHPSFTRIPGVTPPLADGRQPTIIPVVVTLTELDDIVAYAASVPPADLGAPIRHQ